METRVKVFENEEFGRVRTTTIGEEPYFVGKDVAEILGYAKPRNAIIMHVDDEDKKDAPIQGDLGGVQQMTVVLVKQNCNTSPKIKTSVSAKV